MPKWGKMFGQGHCRALAKEVAANALQRGAGLETSKRPKETNECGLGIVEVGANARPGGRDSGPQESGQAGSAGNRLPTLRLATN